MTKDQYVNYQKKLFIKYKESIGEPIELHILKELIKQWRFDYDIERSMNS
jgi:hypothetical protein